jgi:L-fuconolactonase
VHVKLSALPQLSAESFPHDDIGKWVRDVLAEFGAVRLMWGSDFPFTEEIGAYVHSLTVLDYLLPGLSSVDKARIVGGTAREIYRLPSQ